MNNKIERVKRNINTTHYKSQYSICYKALKASCAFNFMVGIVFWFFSFFHQTFRVDSKSGNELFHLIFSAEKNIWRGSILKVLEILLRDVGNWQNYTLCRSPPILLPNKSPLKAVSQKKGETLEKKMTRFSMTWYYMPTKGDHLKSTLVIGTTHVCIPIAYFQPKMILNYE